MGLAFLVSESFRLIKSWPIECSDSVWFTVMKKYWVKVLMTKPEFESIIKNILRLLLSKEPKRIFQKSKYNYSDDVKLQFKV